MAKKKKKKGEPKELYPHNPRYSMIVPDAAKRDGEDISSTGQS